MGEGKRVFLKSEGKFNNYLIFNGNFLKINILQTIDSFLSHFLKEYEP